MRALLIVLGTVGLAIVALLLHRTSRRLLATFAVALKWGLLWLAQLFGLRWLGARLRGRPYEKLSRPRLLRLVFEDLGPTYIKLGQIVASSPGLFTEPYVVEFRRCLDRVRPFPSRQARAILVEELGERAAELSVEDATLASASVAQVHAARRRDGTQLVVKVQRPGIQERIRADVRIMRFWARVVELLVPTARLANPSGIIEDFGKTIAEELDFRREGRSAETFNQIMKELDHPRIVAPRIEWDFTTGRVLTMERFFGHNVDDAEAIRSNTTVNTEEQLLEGMRAWFQCVILYGFFHGDVHAGNLMWLDDGRIGFLDFGIVGRFDDQQRQTVTRYVMAFVGGNFKNLAQIIWEINRTSGAVDLDAMAADLERTCAANIFRRYGKSTSSPSRDCWPQALQILWQRRTSSSRSLSLSSRSVTA
jgi:aarF domain-containing kinase